MSEELKMEVLSRLVARGEFPCVMVLCDDWGIGYDKLVKEV